MSVFRKHDDGPVSTALEAQGLVWLAEVMADGGTHVMPATGGPGWLEEPRLTTIAVTPAGAEAFGRALAVTHTAGAPTFGAVPSGWDGRAQMGRSDTRLRLHAVEEGELCCWGEFYAEDQTLPYLQPSRDNGSIGVGGARIVERLCKRLRGGDFDTDQPALMCAGARKRGAWVAVARTHGNLWCGNVPWVPADEAVQQAPRRAGPGSQELDPWQTPMSRAVGGPMVVGVLIDPVAQGVHTETDLAALGVFGQRYLGRIYAAYHEVSPLAEGWRERAGLHSWHIIMVHAFLFDGGYGGEAVAVARQYL